MSVLAAVAAAVVLAGAPVPRDVPVAIPATDGVTLSGTLSLPAGPGPYPAALIVNGFGPNNRDGVFGFGEGSPYEAWARGLVRRDVAVLRYDKRGVGRTPGDPLSWLDARPLARDAAAAARALAARPEVDRRRVAMVGHSQGGALTFAVARRTPATRVVTLASPGRPLGRLAGDAGESPSRLLRRLAGAGAARATLGPDPRRAAARTPQPALLIHGLLDRTVPPSDLAALAAVRRRAGHPTRVLRLRGGNHFLLVGGVVPPPMLDRIAAFVRGSR
jgi:uncharacterized protein